MINNKILKCLSLVTTETITQQNETLLVNPIVGSLAYDYPISAKAFFIAAVAVVMASSADISLSDLSNGSVPTGPS